MASLEGTHRPIEESEIFRLFEECADQVWLWSASWDGFSKGTIGRQFVRAMDSVNANLVEGDGRYSDAEAIQFFRIARASAREAKLWAIRAGKRSLIPEDAVTEFLLNLTSATKQLNLLINYRRRTKNLGVKETIAPYIVLEDPFAEECAN